MDIKQIFAVFIITICAIVFTACGNFSPAKDNPSEFDMVYSNGGIAVQKGEYLYYTNGFLSQADLKYGDNNFGDVKYSGIYRTQLNGGYLVFDENDEISNSECIVPKVVGYEQGNFYIFNNNIFYTSPNGQKNRKGELQNALMDFYISNVNGANAKRLYTTQGEYSTVKYGMKKFGDTIYLIIIDQVQDDASSSTKLVLRTIKIKNGVASAVATLDENISEAFWTEQSNYDARASYNNPFDKFVYYTVNKTDGNVGAGNIVKKVDLTNGEISILADDNATTYTLKAIGSDRIYYTTSVGNINNVLYANTLTSASFVDSQSPALRYNSYANYSVVNGGNQDYEGGLLLSDSTNGTVFISASDYSVQNISSSEQYYLLFNKGSKIYLRSSSSMIYELDLANSVVELNELLSSDDNAKIDANKYVDYTNRYVLYYGEYKNSSDATKYYMHIVDLDTINQDTLLPKNSLLASLLDEDIIKDEE